MYNVFVLNNLCYMQKQIKEICKYRNERQEETCEQRKNSGN